MRSADRATIVVWGWGTLVLLLSVLLDRWAYLHLGVDKPVLETYLPYQAARRIGTLWVWLGAAVCAGLVPGKPWPRRMHAAARVIGSAILAGAATEILKVVIGRERPLLHDGFSVFHPFAHVLSGRGLSFPSSHAAVAFGGAWSLTTIAARSALGRLGSGAILLAAAACGLSRVLAGAHFVSDVVAAAIVGLSAAHVLNRTRGWSLR